MTCWDEREWPDVAVRVTWIDRLIRWVIGAVLVVVLSLAAIGGIVVVGAVVTVLSSRIASAAEPSEVLLVVDRDGRELLRCVLPVSYLLPPAKAIVCDQPATVYHDGFEP